MDDYSIYTAVAAWLSNSASAEATYGHISTWDTSEVTSMSQLFLFASSFNEDIGAWDTSGVTTMQGMLASASAFNRDIGDWAVDSVTDMTAMFYDTEAFNQDIGDWAVHSVRDMRYMFTAHVASAFNQDLGDWAVHSVTDMSYMFRRRHVRRRRRYTGALPEGSRRFGPRAHALRVDSLSGPSPLSSHSFMLTV